MNALAEMLDEAVNTVRQAGGYIAIAGALPRNLPPWVSESRAFRFIPENGHVSSTCRLLLVGRFAGHSAEKRLRKEASRSVPGLVKFGMLNKLLDKYKPGRERSPTAAVLHRDSATTTPTTTPQLPQPSQPSMNTTTSRQAKNLPKPRRGECKVLVELYESQILERADRQESGASIARWLALRAKEQGFHPAMGTLLQLVYGLINRPRLERTEGSRLVEKSEELRQQEQEKERVSVPVSSLLPDDPMTSTSDTQQEGLAKLGKSIDQVAPSVTEALEALSRSLSGIVEIDKENQRLRAENAALKERLEKLKAALN